MKKTPVRWPLKTIVVNIDDSHLLECCTERGCPCEGEDGMCVRCGQEIGALSEACPGPRKDFAPPRKEH